MVHLNKGLGARRIVGTRWRCVTLMSAIVGECVRFPRIYVYRRRKFRRVASLACQGPKRHRTEEEL